MYTHTYHDNVDCIKCNKVSPNSCKVCIHKCIHAHVWFAVTNSNKKLCLLLLHSYQPDKEHKIKR